MWCFLIQNSLRTPLSVVLLFQSREVGLPIPRFLPDDTKVTTIYIYLYIICMCRLIWSNNYHYNLDVSWWSLPSCSFQFIIWLTWTYIYILIVISAHVSQDNESMVVSKSARLRKCLIALCIILINSLIYLRLLCPTGMFL